jgi:hypothetical protein
VAFEILAEATGARPWRLPDGAKKGFDAMNLFLGRGKANPLEVAVARAERRPTTAAVRNLWNKRQGNRPSPLLLVVTYDSIAGVCGPVGPDPAVELDLGLGQVERIALAALAEPDRHAAIRLLQHALPEVTLELPGIRNVGMFASHQLRAGVPERADWPNATEAAKGMLRLRGRELVEALGFSVETHGATTSLLVSNGRKYAVAVFLDETESPDLPAPRFSNFSPIFQALEAADSENLPFVVMTRGSQIRVYTSRNDVGVGRKGRAETFIEANLALLPDDRAGYLPLIFGAAALKEEGSFWSLLEDSRDFASELGKRLRERVYEDVVPTLAKAIAGHFGREPDEADLGFLYEQALVILYRLLFIAYAEDKELLPYRSNGRYQARSLKALARDLSERANQADEVDFDEHQQDLWERVRSLFRAVDQGHREWGVPRYNGGLFGIEPERPELGEAIRDLELTNNEIGPALLGLLVDETPDGHVGPVDFRSLSVREFGTIYEGLLQNDLAVAPSALTLDKNDLYVPASSGDDIAVEKGAIYLHNKSGARKASGSYFTKPFAVDHLLDHALEPALDDHIRRLEELMDEDDEHAATEAFFDFRCVDIAMGSGHFLVAAVDRIEARLSSFLARRPIPGVVAELERLRAAAYEALGDHGQGVDIEHASLLRRQVARRCVYGVDLSSIAVELARLSLWIHTFVPGLPLSFLNHNLIEGNSLTGIGDIQEAVGILDPGAADGTVSILREQIEDALGEAKDALKRLARTSDAGAAEIAEARKAHADAEKAIEPVHDLFNLLIGVRLGEVRRFETFEPQKVATHPDLPKARELADRLEIVHFPIAFPEVFHRERPGFDCIIGNPPWEKVKVEEHVWWGLRFPGLRSMTVGKQDREIERLAKGRPDLAEEYQREVEDTTWVRGILTKGPYPGMGTGDPDLYKAFTWRFWHLIREHGRIGVVLPRSALAASGSAPWRERILDEGEFENITMLLNTGNWAFDDMEPRYTIGLVAIRKGHEPSPVVRLRGPYASLAAYRKGGGAKPVEFPVSDFRGWATGAAFPLLPTPESGEVFLKLRAHPRFDDRSHPWRARPIAELHATGDKHEMIVDPESTDGLWPVYKGASFNLWEPDTGEYYAWADPDHVRKILKEKRVRQQRRERSAFSEFDRTWASDPATLPCLFPRIAFRDVARATDSRTMILALCPPQIVLNHTAPYLLWPRGDERDQAYTLGVLSSIPFDWYTRRVVETHVTFEILGALPIPNPDRADPVRRRVEEFSGRLAAPDDRFTGWAEAVGVPVGSAATPDERADLTTQLDAAVALLYGLEESDVTHILETFHVGWDYRPRLEAVLGHLRELKDLA